MQNKKNISKMSFYKKYMQSGKDEDICQSTRTRYSKKFKSANTNEASTSYQVLLNY